MTYAGAALPLSRDRLTVAAAHVGVDPAVLWSVVVVETSGCGFLPDRRPTILFERQRLKETGARFDSVSIHEPLAAATAATFGGSVTAAQNLTVNGAGGLTVQNGNLWVGGALTVNDSAVTGTTFQNYVHFHQWIQWDGVPYANQANWTISSDPRVKTDIGFYARGLDAVLALRPITFKYNGLGETPADETDRIGLDASAVREAAPEMVGSRLGKLHPDDSEPSELLTLDTGPLPLMLINCVKELAAQNAALEARIAALEGAR